MSGIIDPVNNQAIRKEAAQDLAHLDAHFKISFADEAVAHGLGHSTMTMAKGITEPYVGPAILDTHTNEGSKGHPVTP